VDATGAMGDRGRARQGVIVVWLSALVTAVLVAHRLNYRLIHLCAQASGSAASLTCWGHEWLPVAHSIGGPVRSLSVVDVRVGALCALRTTILCWFSRCSQGLQMQQHSGRNSNNSDPCRLVN
jgi:hypothetical protein